MKESLKRLGIKKGSLLGLAIMFATVPLPFLKGSPTGMIYTHDHVARYVRLNSINLDNHKIAIADGIDSLRSEIDMSNKIQDKRVQVMLLEIRLDSISRSNYDIEEKRAKTRKVERRIDRLYDQLDRDGIKRDEIKSATKKLMIAVK